MKNNMKKALAGILAVGMMAGTLTACGGNSKANQTSDDQNSGQSGKSITMKVGLGVPESHFEYKAVEEMQKYVDEKTGGAIKMELYGSNQLGNDKQVFESLKLGVAHMLPCGVDVIGTFVKEFTLLSLPFLFDDMEQVQQVTEGEWGQELLAKLEPIGYVGLGFGDFGFRNITNSKHPIEQVSDLNGLKIRTMENPMHLEVFKALGANPTPMGMSEVFSALQQGVIDGQENPLMNIYSNKLHEVQPYLTIDEHVYTLVAFVLGKDWFSKLSADQQTILQEGVDIAKQYMRDAVVEEDAYALEQMEAYGVQVTELNPDVREEMKEIVQPVCDKFGNEINPEFYQELLDAIAAAKA